MKMVSPDFCLVHVSLSVLTLVLVPAGGKTSSQL